MENEERLNSLQASIKNCDDKATSLLSAVGIIFGFSLFSFDLFKNIRENIRPLFIVFGCIYLLLFLIIIVLLVLVFFSRRYKNNKYDYSKYHEHLHKHTLKGDLIEFLKNTNDDIAIIEQIAICSSIAHKKENLLRAVAFLICFFALTLVLLVLFLFL